ncbi:helix-turn-helix domain-containing protein [Kocuria sp. CPCC 205263]
MGTHSQTTVALPRLLGMKDLADYLGVPLQTVRRWRVDDYGPAGFTVGRYVKYRTEDVEAWIRERLGEAA